MDIKEFKESLPNRLGRHITESMVKKIEDIEDNPIVADTYRENLLGHTNILNNSRYSIEDYVNAVKYITYKLVGNADIDAYKIVFPDRYNRLVAKGLDRSGIGPYVSAYNKSKLVVELLEQTMIPTHIVNAPLHQQSINELVNIGMNGRSEIARVQALKAVVEATKAPEESKIKIDVGIDAGDSIKDLREAAAMLAKQQRLAIENGGSKVLDIAESKIVYDVEECD
jgi:hypothetical protein